MSHQLHMDFARQARDAGMARALEATHRTHQGWCAQAVEALRLHARSVPNFIIEEARRVIAADLPEPHDLRSWGSVTMTAVRLGYIERVDGEFRRAASSNASPKQVYRAVAA